MKHEEDCCRPFVSGHLDITGINVRTCFGCRAFEHDPLVFHSGYLGHLTAWPDLEHTPYGHESGLLDFGRFTYSRDFTFHRGFPEKQPIIKAPVPVAFDPAEIIAKEDGKEHEGVPFHELWADPIARTVWLGYKPFIITSQYFRGYCVGHANDLRKHPERLLGEHVSFHFDGDFGMDGRFMQSIVAQLVPYLLAALDLEGLWPFLRLPRPSLLNWEYQPQRKVA